VNCSIVVACDGALFAQDWLGYLCYRVM